MFEDSTFESNGRIRTRSRRWMIATFLFNGSILLGLILIPLIYPEALQRQALMFLLTAPTAPPALPAPRQTAPVPDGASAISYRVPLSQPVLRNNFINAGDPDGTEDRFLSMNDGSGLPGGTDDVFKGRTPATVVHEEPKGPLHISSGVMEGIAIQKSAPIYPFIAKEAGVQGTVVLLATISKNGSIENLRIASGPAMLQQAAIDAVKTWRYKPYLLNGQPVEVETTVNVVFALGR
jgi:protein TonB